MIQRWRNLPLRAKVATGMVLAAVVLTAVAWPRATDRPGRLPTAQELKQPFANPGAAGAPGPTGSLSLLSEEQGKALQEGKTVTMSMPGGGSIVIGPAKKAPSPAGK
jgi:hypothetical protein